ncbi:MAG: hypothetical protein HC831_23655 [Chloroflexia bacterium]|nr:hypothetical protein [Chloroflexia bacterium]
MTTKITVLAISTALIVGVASAIATNILSQKKQQQDLKQISELLFADYDRLIKSEVETVITYLKFHQQNTVNSGISKDSAMLIAANYIRDLRYGESGYFWIDDSKGNNVVLLGREAEGKTEWIYKTLKGII